MSWETNGMVNMSYMICYGLSFPEYIHEEWINDDSLVSRNTYDIDKDIK